MSGKRHAPRLLSRPSIIALVCGVAAVAALSGPAARAAGGFWDSVRKSLKEKPAEKRPPLHDAIWRDDLARAKQLLDGGAQVNTLDAEGRTPLYLAADFGRTPIVELLIARGGDVERQPVTKISPLYAASFKGHVAIVSLLLKAGAEVDARCDRDITALFGAVEGGNAEAARLLLAAGADANARSKDYFPDTPLQLATLLGETAIVKELLKHKADPNAANAKHGLTPLHMALAAKRADSAALLRAAGARDDARDAFGLIPARTAELLELRAARQLLPADRAPQSFDPQAIVILAYYARLQSGYQFGGTQVAFAIGDGTLLVTAAHCVDDYLKHASRGLLATPLAVSRYHGDVVETRIVAVDKKADVALLRVRWGPHPALKIASPAELAKAKELLIAGYPPLPKVEGERSRRGRSIFVESAPLLSVDPQRGKRTVILGGGKFAGPGWSGSPMIVPATGKLAGVFGWHDQLQVDDILLHNNLAGGGAPPVVKLARANALQGHLAGSGSIDRLPEGAADSFRAALDWLELRGSRTDKPRALRQAQAFARLRPRSAIAQLFVAWSAFSVHLADRSNREALALAEGATQNAVKYAPASAYAYAARGNLLAVLQRYDEARPLLERALALEPGLVFAELSLMTALTETHPARAEALAEKLKERLSADAGFWFAYGGVLRAREKHDAAVAAIEKAVALAPKAPYGLRLASVLAGAGRLAEAEAQYKKLTQKNPKQAAFWFYYARFLAERHPTRASEARAMLKKAETLGLKTQIKQTDHLKLQRTLRKLEQQPPPNAP